MDDEAEVLHDEPVRLPHAEDERTARGRAPVRHPARWTVAALLLLVVAGLGAVDTVQRSHESAALNACQSALRRASDHADYRMGLTTNYVRPVSAHDARRTHLADLMAPLARAVLPAVQRADRLCSSVHVRPWHFSLVARQHDVTAYSGALVTLLQIVAAQGGTFHDDTTLLQLRNAAGVAGG